MLYCGCFFRFDHDWFGFVIIAAIRFLTSACEWFTEWDRHDCAPAMEKNANAKVDDLEDKE